MIGELAADAMPYPPTKMGMSRRDDEGSEDQQARQGLDEGMQVQMIHGRGDIRVERGVVSQKKGADSRPQLAAAGSIEEISGRST